MVYLADHPPARTQFRRVRRATPTGAIVVHTAENTTDKLPPDGGAEGVARFISQRTDGPGSYHSVVDSDSTVRVGRYSWEMFHEGTGGNRWSLGLSFACQAHQWPGLPEWWVTGALEQGALEAARMAAWVKAETGVVVPDRRITPTQYRAGAPGFVGHGELDPGRRSDPGAGFPWSLFLIRFRHHTRNGGDPMLDLPADREATIRHIQQVLSDAGYDLGPTGVDGDPGPPPDPDEGRGPSFTLAAVHAMKNDLKACRVINTELRAQLEEAGGDAVTVDKARRYDVLAAEVREMVEGG